MEKKDDVLVFFDVLVMIVVKILISKVSVVFLVLLMGSMVLLRVVWVLVVGLLFILSV